MRLADIPRNYEKKNLNEPVYEEEQFELIEGQRGDEFSKFKQ